MPCLHSNSVQGEQGFTVVELVTVILLLGILSTVALSRSVNPGSFDARLVRDFVVEEFRLARQVAMARQDLDVAFQLQWNANEWLATTRTGTLVVHQSSQSRGDVELMHAGTDLEAGAVLSVVLTGRGEVRSAIWRGADVTPVSTLALSVVDEGQNLPLCLYANGYLTDSLCR